MQTLSSIEPKRFQEIVMLAQSGLSTNAMDMTIAAPRVQRFSTAISPGKDLSPVDRFTKFGHAVTIKPGEIARVGKRRSDYEPGAFEMEDLVNRYANIIPPAGQMLLKKRLLNPAE